MFAAFVLPMLTSRARSRGNMKPCQDASPACLATFDSGFWMKENATAELAEALASWRRADVLAARDRSNHSALNMAAYRSHLDGVRALIAAGADVNNPDLNKHRPLHHSVLSLKPSPEIVRTLLEAGASVRADKKGSTPLDYAQKKGLTQIVALLQSSVDVKNGRRRE